MRILLNLNAGETMLWLEISALFGGVGCTATLLQFFPCQWRWGYILKGLPIIVSERIVREIYNTSYDTYLNLKQQVRDTKRGEEE